jgi:hypothetical protein
MFAIPKDESLWRRNQAPKRQPLIRERERVHGGHIPIVALTMVVVIRPARDLPR